MPARQLLDQVQAPAQLDALAAAPGAFAERLAADLPPFGGPADGLAALEARDAVLAGAVADIDALIARAMRIRLEHALASDTSLAPPTRKVFASTVVRYADDLGLLAGRVRDLAARGGAPDPDAVAAAVVAAAQGVLALREGLGEGVAALIREACAAAIPEADRRARRRDLDEPTRRRWSAARRELEAVVAAPGRVATAPWAARLATHPEQLDEPAPAPEPTLAELIELD